MESWTHALEWRIAWRHLRAGERHPRWVDALTFVSVFMLVVGLGFWLWAAQLGPAPAEGEQLFSAAVSTAQQRNFGVFGGLSIAIGSMLLVLAALARFFNLLATIITMSVLLGCMALVVVLSLMSGLEVDLRDKILNQKAHLRISAVNGNRFTDYDELVTAIGELPEVTGASPYLEAEIMVRSGINRQGAALLGVVPDQLLSVSSIADIMREGSFDALTHPEQIPDADPFSGSTETPWRLRHLDKDKDKPSAIRTKAGKSGKTKSKAGEPKPAEPAGSELVGPPPRPHKQPTGLNQEPEQAPAPAGKPTPKPGLIPPPPTELFGPGSGPFGPSGLPGLGKDDEGWEDPVEVLGLEPDDDAAPADPASELPPAPSFGEQDEGWEDPVEVLELPDEQPGSDPGAGPDEGGEDPREGDGEAEPASDDGPPDDEQDVEAERAEGVIDPVLIGRELANELAVGLGTRVQLITPVGRLTPAGRVPGILAAKVGGVFHSGMYEYDRKNVYTPLPVAQAFLRTGDRVTGIEVKLHDIDELDAGKRAVEAELRAAGRTAPYLQQTIFELIAAIEDPAVREEMAAAHGLDAGEPQLVVESWKELNRNLFSAMFLEKIAMFVALLFVVLVASFGILASNLMSVLEKSKEIAILKAMGSQDSLILRVFVAEGLCLGLLGAVGGISVGLALCWALDRFGFPFNENVYYIERLPVVINPVEVAVVGFAALVIVFLSSLYPARVASRMRPVDGLRQQEK